jgi:hypothetical protein
MCDVSHRNNIALHRNKSKRFFSWHASHAQMRGLITARLDGRNAAIKRRPSEGGLSLGRKRPRRAYAASAAHRLMWRQEPQMQELNRTLVQLN